MSWIETIIIILSSLFGGGIITWLFSNTPKIDIEKPGIKKIDGNQFWRLQITMLNSGHRPASNLYGEIIIFKQDLRDKPQIINFSVANKIYFNSPTPYYNDGIKLFGNMDPYFIILKIKYRDWLIPHSETFFMKWGGITNGKFHPDFTHTSSGEKKKIKDYLKKNRKS